MLCNEVLFCSESRYQRWQLYPSHCSWSREEMMIMYMKCYEAVMYDIGKGSSRAVSNLDVSPWPGLPLTSHQASHDANPSSCLLIRRKCRKRRRRDRIAKRPSSKVDFQQEYELLKNTRRNARRAFLAGGGGVVGWAIVYPFRYRMRLLLWYSSCIGHRAADKAQVVLQQPRMYVNLPGARWGGFGECICRYLDLGSCDESS